MLGLVSFAVQLPIALGTFGGLAAWMLLSSRGQRGTLPDEVTRLGALSGGGALAGGAVAALAMLLPRGSFPRRAAVAIGGAPGAVAALAMPVWFLRLGRALSTDDVGRTSSSRGG